MSKNMNEPAFPVTNCAEHEFVGLTLRDYFAAKAMQSMCAVFESEDFRYGNLELAQMAYSVADAMLEERAK